MWARTFRTISIALALGALAAGQVHAQQRAVASATVTLRVRVGSVVRMVLERGTTAPDGSPRVRVESNDPAVRAAFLSGVTPEAFPSPETTGIAGNTQHRKGDAVEEDAPSGLVRYTVVAP